MMPKLHDNDHTTTKQHMPVHGEILGGLASLERPMLGAAAEVSPSEGLRRKALLEKLSERVIDPCDGDTMTSPRGFKRHESCPEKGRRFNVEAPTTPTTRMRPSLSTVKGAKKKSDADFDFL